MRTIICAFATVLIGACTAVDVSKEVTIFEKATAKVGEQTGKALKPVIEQVDREAPLRAAQASERWQLSEGCLQRIDEFEPLDSCFVRKRPFTNADGNAELTPEQIRAAQLLDVQRKLSGLVEYTELLGLLASSQTEDDLILSFSVLQDSINGLAEATGREGLADFAASLSGGEQGEGQEDGSVRIEETTRFAISNLRRRLMKQAVEDAHDPVLTIISEIKSKLPELNLETDYQAASDRMFAANRRAREARISDDINERAQAYAALEKAHADFVKVAQGSLYTTLNNLAVAHGGLRERLARRPDPQEIVAYLKSLRELSETLEL